jgi:cytochrome b subunit of formate dehydrogenase
MANQTRYHLARTVQTQKQKVKRIGEGMPVAIIESIEEFPISPEDIAAEDENLTYVEGVGVIPRDIYRHVQSDPFGDLPRYSIHIVIQHFLVFASFIVLAATGLPLYFSDLFWASHVLSLFGGADAARLIHRISATVMVVAAVYHLITIIGGTIGQIINRRFDYKRSQIPRLKDLFDLIHDIKYFLGREPQRPKMEKFMYKQKLHYLAILWGNAVLISAGATLLFPEITARLWTELVHGILPEGLVKLLTEVVANFWALPAFFQDFARLMHVDEAIMALIVVAFWHLTNVHLVPGRFPAQWTFLTGKITREHQIEEHFLEYLNNLEEIPEERAYMRNLLKEKGFYAEDEVSVPSQPEFATSLSQAEVVEN